MDIDIRNPLKKPTENSHMGTLLHTELGLHFKTDIFLLLATHINYPTLTQHLTLICPNFPQKCTLGNRVY